MTKFLIKYGEISLKGANRSLFEQRLSRNLIARIPTSEARIRRIRGRMFLSVPESLSNTAEAVLSTTFGVVSFAQVLSFSKDKSVFPKIAEVLSQNFDLSSPSTSFKIEATREDKHFPLNSYDIACLLGDLLQKQLPNIVVDVHQPDVIVRIEVRDKIYVYTGQSPGPGGLPVGCSGSGLLLLSGGIDSPVAGYLMGGRGLSIDAVYFHSYPFTSNEAEEKVHSLATTLAKYLPQLNLFVVPFTDVQVRIKQTSREGEVTLLMRCAMMKIANLIAEKHGHSCLITGESLGQVASQTVKSMHLTGSYSSLPVFRPLVGQPKEKIISLANEIDTFETSILPYPDCCTLFAPRHPVINPVLSTLKESYKRLDMGAIISEVTAATQVRIINTRN